MNLKKKKASSLSYVLKALDMKQIFFNIDKLYL